MDMPLENNYEKGDMSMTETVPTPTPAPGDAHKRLEVFIGKWINEGHTIASVDGARGHMDLDGRDDALHGGLHRQG